MADKEPNGLVDMTLPKGTMTGSLKVLAPLLIWMSIGWFSYPYLIKDIADAAGESMNIEEVRTFSLIMTGVCLSLGILFGIMGFRGKTVDENEFKRMTGELVICQHCHREAEKKPETIKCQHCDGYL